MTWYFCTVWLKTGKPLTTQIAGRRLSQAGEKSSQGGLEGTAAWHPSRIGLSLQACFSHCLESTRPGAGRRSAIRGWERTKPTPSVDWRTVTVDVVIPAKDEENSLALCLSSVFQQDFPIRSITVVDDGSKDRTSEAAHHYCDVSGHAVNLIRREKPQGKTPSVREITETSDADAIFVVDADTVLLGRDYISNAAEVRSSRTV